MGAEYFSGALEVSSDFHPEIDVHGRLAAGRMVIEKYIVAVGAQSGVPPEEIPDLVQRRFPSRGNLSDPNLPAHGGEHARVDGLNGDVRHDGLGSVPRAVIESGFAALSSRR